jgi:hypothetical protein
VETKNECECSLRAKLVGNGCRYCNPQEYIDTLRDLVECLSEEREWVGLTRREFEECVDGLEDLEDCWVAIEAKLKEKNA